MSSIESFSGDFGSSSSTASLPLNESPIRLHNAVYNATHSVEVAYSTGLRTTKNVLITVINNEGALKIKIRERSFEFSFNYTLLIDWNRFEQIKLEQSLEIVFDEFQPQLIDMLKQASQNKLLLRFDVTDYNCKMIFFERNRLKSLVFLTLDLRATDQKELVEEMSTTISQLKEVNASLWSRVNKFKVQIREAETKIKHAENQKAQLQAQFHNDLQLIERTSSECCLQTEKRVARHLTELVKRHERMVQQVSKIKQENLKKLESERYLTRSMQNLRVETESSNRTSRELKVELEILSAAKTRLEQNCTELRQNLSSKLLEVETLQNQNSELRRDVQDATLIIAQKTKTNDEIGKDLVQANQMIVNFNSHYDALTKEIAELKEKLGSSEKVASEHAKELGEVKREFDAYKQTYNGEEFSKLRHELYLTKQRTDELEKHNREVVTLNNLLTKKVSNSELLDHRSENRTMAANGNIWSSPRI